MTEELKQYYINNVIGEFLISNGFNIECGPRDRDGAFWRFVKKVHSGLQNIEIIDKGRYMIIRFFSQISGTPMSVKYTPSSFLSENVADFEKYDCEEDFLKILKKYKELIIRHGFDCLNNASIIKEHVKITSEHYDYIKYNKERIWQAYINKYCEECKSLDIIIEKIKNLKKLTFEESEWDLIDTASIYGHWLINQYGGQWGEYRKIYGLIDVGNQKLSIDPCNDVLNLWKGNYEISIETLNLKYS